MGKTKARSTGRGPAGPAPPAAAVAVAPRWLVAAWYAAGALTAWTFGYTIMRGSDLWWHLAAGDRMASTGALLHTDPWSYTFEGKPWLNDAWLSDVIYHGWVAAFGLQSLAWWKWGVVTATYLLLMRTLHRVTGDLLSAFAGAVLAAAVGEAFLDIRPQLYSLLGFSVLLSLTLGRQRPSWWLPLLFLVWVQLHAVFVFGLMALAVLLAPDVLRGSAGARKRSTLIGVTCVLACLINPNSVTVFTRPIRYALSDSLYLKIGEWLPPFAPGGIYSPPYPFAIALFAAACVVLLIRRLTASREPLPLAEIVLGALTLAMSLKSRRFVSLFGIAQGVVFALALAPWVRSALAGLGASARRVCLYALPALALAFGLWRLWPYPADSYAFHFLVAEHTFPVDTVNFIQQNQLTGRVFAYYSWGGYLDMRTQGAMKVYVDGRADMVFDEETFRRYVAASSGRPEGLQIIEDSGADYVLWSKKDRRTDALIPQRLLATGRWRLLYEDDISQLLERAGRTGRSELAPPPDTAWRELTLGGAARAANRVAEAEAHYTRALEMMPYLSTACFELVRVQALQGRLAEARGTMRGCNRVYPDPQRYDPLAAWLDRLEAARGG